MCSMCLMIPCHPRCPNALEPMAVKICSRCSDGIVEGETYLDSDEGPICEQCLSDMTLKQYLEYVGEKLATA